MHAPLDHAAAPYRLLVEQIPLVSYINAAGPEIAPVYISPQIEHLLGYEVDQWLEPGFWVSRLHPHDRQWVLRATARTHASGERFHGEYRLLGHDGSYVWVLDETVAVRDERGECRFFHGFLLDVTERKRLEEQDRRTQAELREAERRYRALVERLPLVTYITAPQRGPVTLYMSPQVEDLLGYRRAEWSQPGFWARAMHPDDRERVLADGDHAHLSGERFSAEYRFIAHDGRTVWVLDETVPVFDSGGHCEYFQGFLLDITERRQAEEALGASRARFAELVHNLDAIVWERVPDGSGLTFVSNRAEAILGYPIEIWLDDASFWINHVHPDDRARVEGVWRTQTAAGRDHQFEYRMIAADGRVVWFRDRVRVIVGDDRAPDAVRGVMVDVTEQKEAEARLRQSQKLEAVGQLAGGIAHDFNNLLTAINGYADVALEHLHGAGPTREITEVRRAGERAAALTRQLLAYSRKQVLQPTQLDLNSVVSGIGPMLRRLIGEDITFATHLDLTVRNVRADLAQLEQVIVNLALNARDAMPHGGTVTIATRRVDSDDVEEAGAAPAELVALSVSDTGVGMDEATRARVFEPFFTTKDPGSGTGLGLSTVEGIVAQSGGFLTVETAPGRGATFTIYLPATSASATDAPQSPPPPALRGSETILLVEDEQIVRALVAEMLEARGYSVTSVGDPAEAASIVESGRRFDLVLTDVVMPTMNGRQLIDRLRPLLPDTKVLYMSGYPREAIAARGALEEATHFVQKPFTAAEMAASVRAVLDVDNVKR